MATIVYRVARDDDGWSLTRDGRPGIRYATQEAAFEVALGEAGGDLRSGHDILVQIVAATERSGDADRGGRPTPGDDFHI